MALVVGKSAPPPVILQYLTSGREAQAVNGVIPYIPTDLQSCASPGFFFTANTDADITNAMIQMFNQALQASRLTN